MIVRPSFELRQDCQRTGFELSISREWKSLSAVTGWALFSESIDVKVGRDNEDTHRASVGRRSEMEYLDGFFSEDGVRNWGI